MKDKTIRLYDRIIGIVGIVVCLILGQSIIGTSFETKAFPLALIAILFGLSIALILRKDRSGGYELKELTRILVTFVLIGAYVFLMPRIGFLVTTIAFCVLFMFYHKPDMNKAMLLGFGILYPLLIYYLFHNLLSVRLPAGLLL